VLGKVAYKTNALQYCFTPQKVTNYITYLLFVGK